MLKYETRTDVKSKCSCFSAFISHCLTAKVSNSRLKKLRGLLRVNQKKKRLRGLCRVRQSCFQVVGSVAQRNSFQLYKPRCFCGCRLSITMIVLQLRSIPSLKDSQAFTLFIINRCNILSFIRI